VNIRCPYRRVLKGDSTNGALAKVDSNRGFVKRAPVSAAARLSKVAGVDAMLLSAVGAKRACSRLLKSPLREKLKFHRGASFVVVFNEKAWFKAFSEE